MSAARAAILALLAERAEGATICPSEAARRLAGDACNGDWRTLMPQIHAAAEALLAEGAITLSWRGLPKHERRGPYRIARRS